MIMKKVFACCILVLTLIACEKAGGRRLLNKDYYKQCEISSSDMDGLWYLGYDEVEIQSGEMEIIDLVGEMMYGGSSVSFLELQQGEVKSHYHHIRFYRPFELEIPEVEYVIDKSVSSAKIDFDKKTRKGTIASLDGLNGELTLLESNSSRVELLLSAPNGYYYLIYLIKYDDPQLLNKLRTWEFRDIDQMWEDAEKKWEEGILVG